jgi:hypothetical protein
VIIVYEMIHDTRIIPLDTRPHVGASIRLWNGDPRGHFEGNTLVVDTTNFNDKAAIQGSGPELHVIERFTRISADAITYRVTLEDPGTWTKPWSVEIPMLATAGRLYEYACHEGNYGLPNILSGARFTERQNGDTSAPQNR